MTIETPVKKRKLDLEGIKLLIGSSSIAATIAFWSYFANVDRLANPVNIEAAAASSQVTLNLPPLPTLVSLDPALGSQPSGPAATPAAGPNPSGLRVVTQPQPAAPSNNAPVVVRASRSNGATTSTRAS